MKPSSSSVARRDKGEYPSGTHGGLDYVFYTWVAWSRSGSSSFTASALKTFLLLLLLVLLLLVLLLCLP